MAIGRPTVWAQLGKMGDIMIMLPAWKAIYDATGVPPVVMVAEEFSNILEGVSYVTPWPVKLNWWKDANIAVKMANEIFGHCFVPKFWDCKGAKPPLKRGEPTVNLKFQGRNITVSKSEWESYQLSQWEFAGFTRQQMLEWPLVFDQRNMRREEYMRRQWFKTDKPKLLYNLTPTGGNTSPFQYLPEIYHLLQHTRCELVDLSAIRAFRIYDLLGLYDHAVGLVTSDTSTLHLASASTIPYIAFIAEGGGGSIPKGNCVLSLRYSQVMSNHHRIKAALQDILHENHSGKPNSNLAEYARISHTENTGSLASACQGIVNQPCQTEYQL